MLTIDKLELIFPEFPVPAMILMPDDDIKIVRANPAYLDLLGTSPEELCGRPLFEVFPDDEIGNPDSMVKRSDRVIKDVVAAKEPKSPGAVAYPLPDPHGGHTRLRFFMPEYVPVVDESGAVCYVFHFTHEVKGQLAASQPARHSIMSSFKSILETAHNAFLLTTGEGRVLLANQAACKLFGYNKDEFAALRRHDVLDYGDGRVLALLNERERTNTAKGEVTAIKRSGVRFPCEYSTSRFVDADGQIRCCTEFIDLSKWKEEESRIKQSELNLKAIFNSTPDGFMLLDRNFTILACNEKANTFILLNADHKAVDFKINSSIFEYLEEERQDYFRLVCNKALSGEVVEYERSIRASDDVVHWFCFSVQPVWEGGTVAGLCISGRDITGQKQAEQQFISSEQRFRALVENNQDGIAILSADHRVLYVSPAGEQITGFTEAEARQMDNFAIIHEDDLPAARDIMAEVMASPGRPVKATPIRMQHKDGSWRWVEATITNMLHDPAVRGIIDNFWDVTERIRSKRRLLDAKYKAEQSEIKYRKIFNDSPLPKWIYDLETLQITEVNEAAIQHYGYSREEFLSMTILDIRPAEDREEIEKLVRELPRNKPVTLNYLRHIKKNGEIIFVDVYGHPTKYNDQHARMVVCRDVTERLAYLQAVEEQNKQLREIAWFQSHIVRAPLARIMGLVDLLTAEQTESNLQEILPMLEKSAEELDYIIHDIVDKTKTINRNLGGN